MITNKRIEKDQKGNRPYQLLYTSLPEDTILIFLSADFIILDYCWMQRQEATDC